VHILEISCYYHDAAALREGVLVAAAQEERFTRRKNDPELLTHAIGTLPRSLRPFREALLALLRKHLWIKDRTRQHLGIPPDRILFVEHRLVRATNAFCCPPFSEASILTVDNVGEWTTAALWSGTADWNGGGANRINLSHELRFPHPKGLLCSAFVAFLGFEVNEGKYKVMRLAP